MRHNKKIIFFLLILFLLLFAIFVLVKNDVIENVYYNILEQFYGEPFSEEGLINNSFFGIKSDGTNADSTTKGINKAIEYANKNNIEYIKLEKGTYLIDGTVTDRNKKNSLKGIIVKSNIKFDLNFSKLIHVSNDREMYTVISCYDLENVEIFNGILIGDMQNHNYDVMNSTHEWGYGIDIKASENIKVHNIEIYYMTGDGISISNLPAYATESKITRNSENIEIYNCNIHDNRRQGISVISAETIIIRNNEIHDIEGTAPRSCIDLETNLDPEQRVDDVWIYENKLYNLHTYEQLAILTYNYVYNVNIENNEIYGRIDIDKTYDTVKINNNVIKEGFIVSNINLDSGDRLIIENNIMENTYLSLNNTSYIVFRNNSLHNSAMEVNNSTMAIYNNIANEDNTTKAYAFMYGVRDGIKNKYNIYSNNNIISGKYQNQEYVTEASSPYITINREIEDLKNFLSDIGENYE